jgi:membrane-associated phospholipid phosphatase
MKDYQVIILISGILFSQIIAKTLKKIIKQSRPIKSKTYGMPSSRSTVVSFIVFYLILTNKFKLSTKFIIIILGLLSLSMKYIIKEHSIYQLIVGGILGIIIAYLSSLIKFD